MDKKLYSCLEELSKLGKSEWRSAEKVCRVVGSVKEQLGVAGQDGVTVLETVTSLLACVDASMREDVRLECGCLCVAVLHRLYELFVSLEGSPPSSSPPPTKARLRGDPETHPPPPHLISLQQTQVVATVAHLALYSVVLAGLDQEAASYIRMSLARAKFVHGSGPLEVATGGRQPLLAATFKLLLPVVKHDALGARIRQAAFPEVLSGLLCLCFCPAVTRHHPKDTTFFRGQLQDLMEAVDTSVILKHLLLLMGMAQGSGGCNKNGSGGRGWLGRTCNSLVVRRYLLAEGGLQRVVGAGLLLCDGHDARRCQAVATLVAHARTPDLDQFYSALCPQVVTMLDAAPHLASEVMRVVVLLAGELSERSSSLAALHLGQPLLQVLHLTTHAATTQPCIGTSLTPCVTTLHTLMVETAPPTPALVRLLQPVLCPLLAIATMATTHLRTPSRRLLTRYMSHLTEQEAVNTLINLAGLASSITSPVLHPDVALVLDETGGVKVEVHCDSHNVLEEDEARAGCISTILEEVGQAGVVLAFYKKLVGFLDFREKECNRGSDPRVVNLRTEADKTVEQFERMRQVATCVGLLSHLAESEKLTGDLFQDLTAAGPVVDGLLRAGCQECHDEGLRNIQASLTVNVLVLLSCYLTDRNLRGQMTFGDWAGLKALLPVLELVEECMEDEGVQLMATELRHTVATHGAVKMNAEVASGTQRKTEKGKEKTEVNAGYAPLPQSKGRSDLSSMKGNSSDSLHVVVVPKVKVKDSATVERNKRKTENKEGNSVESTKNEPNEKTVKRKEEAVEKENLNNEIKIKTLKEEEKIKENMNNRTNTREEEGEKQNTDIRIKMNEKQVEEGIGKENIYKRTEVKEEKKEYAYNALKVKEEEKEKQNTDIRTKQKEEDEEAREKLESKSRLGGEESDYKTAMDDLLNPLLPIRGHGILALTRLIEGRDAETLEHGPQLMSLFQLHMKEEDSYLYLMAVKGLAALCDVMPDKAVCVLTREFSAGRCSLEDRAKLAESLSRAARRLGPLLPHYRDHFINAFLTGVRDEEWLVRAASLSALGDVCKELRFSLGPIVHEVFSVLSSMVAQDTSVEVRRAAVLVVTMLLQGLGGDALKVLRDVLRDLYRALRHLEACDSDAVVRLHAQLALQEVDAIMRRFLLPSVGLSKRIYVMDVPPPSL